MFADRFTSPVLATVVLCTLPHFPFLSIWVVLVCVLLWIYVYAAFRYSWQLPNLAVLKVVTAVFFVTAMTTHEGFTIEAFVALLALMVAMKLLEIRSSRDRMITVILCYFLIVSGLFFGDTIGATLYKLLCILITTAVLIHVNHPGRGMQSPLRLALILMVQALPLMLVMFLFFPRIQGGIWGRTHINLARTGFSDKITFGNIAELAQNTAIAFRVEFDGALPPQNQLYWRGAVLWSFDGQSWERGLSRRGEYYSKVEAFQEAEYTITLEPHNEHWLITLDLPTEVDLNRARFLHDFSVYRWRPITNRVIYRGKSVLDGVVNERLRLRGRAVQIPEQGNPRSLSLAHSLKEEVESDAAYIERVLTYFREQPFRYTLRPPPLIRTSGETSPENIHLIDAFLFESRKGFCEHFAGSFAFLMRAADIPARVVVGYQGGERNPYGDYLIVRQSDAHAWCEVWLEDKGWVRVDPTGAVAPDRLTANLGDSLLLGDEADFLSLQNFGAIGQWFGKTGSMMDLMNVRWNRWVMGYSIHEQTGVFATLGMDLAKVPEWSNILLLTLILAVMITILASLFIFRQPGTTKDDTALAWLNFNEKMSKAGLHRPPGQGPVEYMEYICSHRPDLKESVEQIITAYVRLRYSDKPGQGESASLRTLIKRFSPGKKVIHQPGKPQT